MYMQDYRIAVNMEWTSKCNARCVMCPQHLIQKPQLMRPETFYQALDRISEKDVFRVVLAGYGEPTTHPDFEEFIVAAGAHPVRFDMVTNGHLLDEQKLGLIDGRLTMVIISLSSIVPEVYQRVHVGLDLDRVRENIAAASKLLRHTRLAISLTPLQECLDTLPQTIDWLRSIGVENLTMSPTLYNRAGNLNDQIMATRRLRQIIDRYQLQSQEMDFVPGLKDIALQYWKNRFKCVPRNTDLFITSSGHYLYCYNDISHSNTLGHVNEIGIRQVLAMRENMLPINALCNDCNMRHRYRTRELAGVAKKYITSQLIPARQLNHGRGENL
jgi:MoaA/NifB/PqqE/SkfB family radical SAM enzyme